METIFNFLLQSSVGIILFYMVYWLFLQKETFYNANRWFLLSSITVAIFLPIIPIRYTVLVQAENNKTTLQTINDTFKNIPVISGTENLDSMFGWEQVFLIVYLTGAAIFLLRLLTQTAVLIRLIIKYRIISLNGIRIVENEKYGLPFSFFNVIFINPKFHKQDELPEILAHEKVHIRENHWFDLLLIELLTVIFWFNPFIWLFERAIKQNHEYLADKGVLSEGHSVGRYQALLVNQLMGMQIIGITNNLNFALNAKRFKMMTKKKTSRLSGLKFVWTLPVLAILLYAFAQPSYRAKNVEPNESNISIREIERGKTVKMVGIVTDEDGEPMPGVSVVIKGTATGRVCDLQGKFELEVPEDASIILSFVGMKTIVDNYSGIISGFKDGGRFNRKYQMEIEIIGIGLATKLIPERKAPPPPPPPAPIKNGEKEVFYIVEDLPQYPGGSGALNNYVYKMQKKIANSKKVKGKAKVLFTVNAKGKVSDIKIVEKDNEGAAKGAVLIAKEMSNWTPGKQRGKPVNVKYLLPVEFK